jgi:YVTN family beta-propeller protein
MSYGRMARRWVAVALAAATVAILLLPAGSVLSTDGRSTAHSGPSVRLETAPPPGASSPRSGSSATSEAIDYPSVEATLFPDYNGSLPGNYEYGAAGWRVGTPTFVPPASLWYPQVPVSVGGAPNPYPAPTVVFDVLTGGFTGFVPSLTNLSALAYDPANGYVYGTDPVNDTLVVFDPASDQWAAPAVPVGLDPVALTVDPLVGSVFVANFGSNNVSVINASSEQILSAGVPVGRNPVSIVAAPVDNAVFVANQNSTNVTVLNASNPKQFVSPIPLLAPTDSLSYSSALNLVAATEPAIPFLELINASAAALQPSSPYVGTGARAVVASPNGTYFLLANRTGLGLELVNASLTVPIVVGTDSVTESASTLFTESFLNKLYVWSGPNRTLGQVNLTSNVEAPSLASLSPAPVATAFDSADNAVWSAQNQSAALSSMVYWNASLVPYWSVLGNAPTGLAVDRFSGNVYIGSQGLVSEANSSTASGLERSVSVPGNNTGLVVDREDRLLWDLNSVGGLIGLNLTTLTVAVGNTSLPVYRGGGDSVVFDRLAHELFVVDAASSTVYVVNSSTGIELGQPILVGQNVSEAALDPIDGYVYAAGTSLVLINASTFSVGPTLPLPAHSTVGGIVFDPTRNTIEVSLSGVGTSDPGVLVSLDGTSVRSGESGAYSTPLALGPSGLAGAQVAGPDPTASEFLLVPNEISGTISVVASPPLVTSLVITPNDPDVNQTVQFMVTAYGGAGRSSVDWSLPPGCSSSDEFSLYCAPSVPGSYTVSVTLTDALGFSSTTSAALTVGSAFAVQAAVVSPASGQADVGQTISFTAESNHPVAGASATWTFGDGTSAAGLNASHAYSTPGLYSAMFTATDAAGVTASSSVAVDVVPLPQVLVAVKQSNVTDVRVPRTFVATVTGGLPGGGTWTFGDGTTANASTSSHTWTTPGNYSVTYRYVDGGGLSVNGSLNVRVNSALRANISVAVGTTGSPIEFSATPSGGTPPYTVVWGFGDGSNGTGLETNHTFAVAGDYNVTASVYDSVGGSINSTLSVPVNPAAPASTSSSSGNWVSPLILGLILGGAIAAVILFVAEPNRRRPRQPAPSPYVPPAEAQTPVWKE